MRVDRALFKDAARLRLSAPRRVSGRQPGERGSRRLGHGGDFADFRAYGAGDDLRRVDWNVYSRLRSVVVKVFHQDSDQRVAILVDASASMGFGTPRKADHAADLAASLAAMSLRQRDSTALHCLAHRRARARGAGPADLERMVRILEQTEPEGGEDLADAVRRRRGATRLDRAFLISDLLAPDDVLDAAIKGMAAMAHRAVVLHILSDAELAPDLTVPRKLVDAETGDERVIAGTAADRAAYERHLAIWLQAVRHRCEAVGVQYVRAFTDVGPREVLTTSLRNSGVVVSARGS